MSRKQKFIAAATTFGVALSVGFIMQNGDAMASRLAPEQTAKAVQPVITASAITIPDISPEQAEEAAPMIELISLTDDEAVVAVPLGEAEIVVDTCDVMMSAQALPLAMVSLSVQAPCHGSEAITFHHQGMMFKETMDTDGNVDLIVPALAEAALFMMSTDDGAGASTMTQVPDFAKFDRAVLQWQGINAVQLHALEFGADYGSEGHVWSAAARELDFVAPPKDGFLMMLGDPNAVLPVMAEVYTYPSGSAHTTGNVALSVEAEVTADNCGREVVAQSLQFSPGQDAESLDLAMTMPDCGTIGEFLVLKNMFKDLKLAAK